MCKWTNTLVNWISLIRHILMWIEGKITMGYQYLNPDQVLCVNVLLNIE